jgi:hypothetical protein
MVKLVSACTLSFYLFFFPMRRKRGIGIGDQSMRLNSIDEMGWMKWMDELNHCMMNVTFFSSFSFLTAWVKYGRVRYDRVG